MYTAARIVHEMIHFKSYNALQFTKAQKVEPYRIGLSVYDRKNAEVRFNNLNEAVTEELTKRVMMRRLFRDPLFSNEAAHTDAIKASARSSGSFPEVLNQDVMCVRETF